MSDVTPNYLVEQQRIKSAIAAQRNTIEGQLLAILEMADKKARHLENIAAARKAIESLEGKLAELAKTHGALTEDKIKQLTDSIEAPHG